MAAMIFVFCFISLICGDVSVCISEKTDEKTDEEYSTKEYNTNDYIMTFSNSDINKSVVIAKYYIKKKKYEKAIDLIEKKLKKYPNYSEITQELRYYEIMAKSSMLIGSFENKDLMSDIVDLIYNYQESFEVTANVLEAFLKIKSQIKYIKSYQPIQIALQYLKDGNYIAAIHHSNASISAITDGKTITEGKCELNDLDPKSVKLVMKARRIIKVSLKKMGMMSEAANVSITNRLAKSKFGEK